ncbi:L-histidine N(alpha)-methyltransferase [Hyphomicrobium sp.]|uniref:L-histidine N(alpha)-methyltransferase n=1 Tax=Hyphomicrobium sp. TaxID=82 RepID=UPI002D79CEF1|nr:L-histidine N(alpha)-methyltransferase [Hyphomicrobium sp.]HET6390414.1 L-histidine N(alpha)-methyltransferase [Hyphomicrobium sp.]
MRHVPNLETLPLPGTTALADDFGASVIEGLSRPQKTLPCRFLYDARGSSLFEEITELPEYYPTRTEIGILKQCAAEIVDGISSGDVLVEFGSGSSLKTEILLDHIAGRVTYMPLDVSESALSEATARLQGRYPALDIRPLVADFSNLPELPDEFAGSNKTGFFPGSTIGNLSPNEAVALLRSFRNVLGDRGRLIIGVDLKKDPRVLVNAYNDSAGVTAEFNLNLLVRINRELAGTFDLAAFRHKALYNPRAGRIEMHLVSDRVQDVMAAGSRFHFSQGETIHTENSYKYAVSEFRELASKAGWKPKRLWTDAGEQFSVHELI